MSNSSSLPSDPVRSKPFKYLDGTGHRQRMRERLINFDHQFKEYELIEMVLYLLISRKDTKPLAKKILNYFGSIDKFLKANEEDFFVLGLPERTGELLSLINRITYRLTLPDVMNRPYFRVWKNV
ncbi:hypothetical protein COMNV_00475 [Commensalibacter sp. Nvir]|uniref:hypothetical protein n=1 Tax=Commensalibacter sp. Nvir TaxID=3069817 RepID=UPI002D3D4BB3|nr:hypothetical protein COMNV_00475 [Commensalibacter sp. Nvir]